MMVMFTSLATIIFCSFFAWPTLRFFRRSMSFEITAFSINNLSAKSNSHSTLHMY